MTPTPDDKKYATAKGPVNRRTTPARPPQATQQAHSGHARVRVALARQRLGKPLQLQIASARARVAQRVRPGAVTILQVVGCSTAAIGMLLAAIQSAWLPLAASAAMLCCFGAWAVSTRRNRPVTDAPGGNFVEESDINRLDAAMEALAADVPQATVHRLSELKTSIQRCVTLIAGLPPGNAFGGEDMMYVRECVRRYIPDSIHSCLQVPLKDRATLVIDGTKPALDLLHDQLDMIQAGLQTRETRLTQLAGESLMRQQRFLAAKSDAGT